MSKAMRRKTSPPGRSTRRVKSRDSDPRGVEIASLSLAIQKPIDPALLTFAGPPGEKSIGDRTVRPDGLSASGS
jgi:hypothetical protein